MFDRAVIFDNDGVLIHSFPSFAEFYGRHLQEEFDLRISPLQQAIFFKGRSFKQNQGLLIRAFREQKDMVLPPNFMQHGEAVCKKIIERHGMVAIPGMADVISILKTRGWKVGVASNGRRDEVGLKLKISGLEKHFNGYAYSADCVSRPKPAPDMILYAAQSMGVPVEMCVYVGDSLNDMKAAKEAGCFAVASMADYASYDAAGNFIACPDWIHELWPSFIESGASRMIQSPQALLDLPVFRQ